MRAGNDLGLVQVTSSTSQRTRRFAGIGGAWVTPDAWEVLDQGANRLIVLGREALLGLGLLTLGLLLDLSQFAQPRVPLRFQDIGDQPVIRIDPQKAALGQLGYVRARSTCWLRSRCAPSVWVCSSA